jgi:hypothetical protein
MESVWIALGGNAAFLLVVAFLGRKVITHWLDRDLETFKQALVDASALEIEKTRGALQIATNEHSILLSKLQERRADVIGEIYDHIASGIEALESYVRPLQLIGEANRDAKASLARGALIASLHVFDRKQIWLTAECAELVGQFMEELRKTFNRYDIFRQAALDGDDAARREENREWMIAWDRITKDVVVARRGLEAEMRKLLEPVRKV